MQRRAFAFAFVAAKLLLSLIHSFSSAAAPWLVEEGFVSYSLVLNCIKTCLGVLAVQQGNPRSTFLPAHSPPGSGLCPEAVQSPTLHRSHWELEMGMREEQWGSELLQHEVCEGLVLPVPAGRTGPGQAAVPASWGWPWSCNICPPSSSAQEPAASPDHSRSAKLKTSLLPQMPAGGSGGSPCTHQYKDLGCQQCPHHVSRLQGSPRMGPLTALSPS